MPPRRMSIAQGRSGSHEIRADIGEAHPRDIEAGDLRVRDTYGVEIQMGVDPVLILAATVDDGPRPRLTSPKSLKPGWGGGDRAYSQASAGDQSSVRTRTTEMKSATAGR